MAKYKTQTEVIDEARLLVSKAHWVLNKEYKESGREIDDAFIGTFERIENVNRREANSKEKTFTALKKSQYASALFILEYTSGI